MKKTAQNMGFLGKLFSFFLFAGLWGNGRGLWIRKAATALLLIAFVFPPSIVPVMVHAQEGNDAHHSSERGVPAHGSGDTGGGGTGKEGGDHSSGSHDVPPSFEITPERESRSGSGRNKSREQRPRQMLGGDSGTSKEVGSAITNTTRQASVNTNDGSLSYTYGFVLPPGRNNLTPALSLVYNSNNKDNDSIAGYGWSLDIPSIERVNKTGSQNLYTGNVFSSSLSGELVASSTNPDKYLAKTENGDFLSYTFSNNSWTVYDKSGTRYLFGSTDQARQDDVASTTRVYKWMLEEVRDTNDNFIEFDYFKDSGQIYPEYIFYTGHNTTDGIFRVDFILTPWSFYPSMHDTDFEVETKYLIDEIQIKENNQWVRKYEFNFTAPDVGNQGSRRLLYSIRESGRDLDSDSEITKNPTRFFYKQSGNIGWEKTQNGDWELPMKIYDQNSNDPTLIQFADINGDAYTDILYADSFSDPGCSSYRTYINDTRGGWDEYCDGFVSPLPIKNGDTAFPDNGIRFFDFDGDQLSDAVRSYADEDALGAIMGNDNLVDEWSVYKNIASTTNIWSLTDVSVPIGFVFGAGVHADNSTQVVDVNSDGIMDIVWMFRDDDGQNLIGKLFLGTGSGWDEATSTLWGNIPWGIIDENESGQEIYTFGRFTDLNGDGLVDFIFEHEDFRIGRWVGINGGHNWHVNPGDNGSWDLPKPTQTDSYLAFGRSDAGTRFMDVNGDGVSDLVNASYVSPGSPVVGSYTYLGLMREGYSYGSLINGLSPFAFALPNSESTHVVTLDVNADGMEDLLYAEIEEDKSELSATTTLAKAAPFTDMLVGVETPEGATSSISYKISSQYFDEDDNLLNPNLPILVTTVDSMAVNDGFGNIAEENYVYASGTYYYNGPHDKKFAGFGRVEKTDPAGNVTKTYFHQGDESETGAGEYNDHVSKMGKSYRIEQYDNAGNLFSKTINKWDHHDISAAAGATSSFVKLTQSVESTYDGDTDHKEKAESYVYNNSNGNVSEKISWGQVNGSDDGTFSDTGSDKFVTSMVYATSSATSSAPMFLPSRELVLDQASTTVRDTKMYYDSLSFGSVSKGNLTKQEQLKSGSTYIDVEKTYNIYGLVTEEKDPRDKATTYSYDTHNLYPAITTDPLGHISTSTYDYSLGKPKGVKDQNGQIFKVVYDPFDRIAEEKQPDIASPTTLVTKTTYSYVDDTFPTSVTKNNHLDATTSVPTYMYFDGFGRVIQERRRAEDPNTYAVRDTKYNNLGLKQKESLPYFSTGSARTTATATGALYNNFSYDALGRIETIANAVGTTSNAYDDWKLTVTDANGDTKDLYKDARGNLVQVDEHNGASTYTTVYEWNGLGNLTKITDATSNVRNFIYDNLGRRLYAQDLHASSDTTFASSTFSYDDSGNLTTMVDGKGQTVNYTFDDINRPLTEDFTGLGGTEVAYAYDACTNGVGRLCTATSTATTSVVSSFTYDALGKTAIEQKTIGGGTAYQTSYEYDRLGNPTLLTLPDSAQVKYEYNAGGLAEKILRKESGGSFVDVVDDLDYSPEGKITYQLFENGVFTTNTYDAAKLYRLTNKYTETPLGGISPVLQDIDYTYDAVGNITGLDDQTETNNSKTVIYTYDDLSRLLSASTTALRSGSGYKESYTYDPLGNILTKGNSITAYYYQGTTTGSYANPHAVTKIRTSTLTYDPNGNLTTYLSATSTYDYANRLVSHTKGATTTTYSYDHGGNRIKYANGSQTTLYPNRYQNETGSTGATTTTSHIYLGDTMIATLETVGTTTSTYYHHTDHLSGANISTDKDALVSEITDYYPYGRERLNESYNGTFQEQRKFTGHELDRDSSFTYMGARYYDSDVGRFRGVDPVFWRIPPELLLDPQQLNSYSYARNDPINRDDPTGELSLKETGQVVRGYSVGFGRGVSKTIMGTVNSVAHPIQTVKAVGQALNDAAKNAYDLLTSSQARSDISNGLKMSFDEFSTQSVAKQSESVGEIFGGIDAAIVLSKLPAINKANIIAEGISGGHGYTKHVMGTNNPAGMEYGGVISRDAYSDRIFNAVLNKTDYRALTGGREAFYNANGNDLVIYNPRASDLGTSFRPNPTIHGYNDNLDYFYNGLR